jgi:5-deoxy-5-amino-3-dehydroquinate synthase
MERPAGSPARPHVVLVGMMGAGKSSVARRVARHLGWRHVDVDTEVERSAGCTIASLFASEGEAAFRDREAATLRTLLASTEPLVIATGGGSVLRPENRQAMRDRARVVWLRARPDTLAARVGDGASRPLLAGDPLGSLTRIAAERAGAYEAAAHHVVDVDDVPFTLVTERVVQAIDTRSRLRLVRVPLAERAYDVLVGRGARRRLASVLPSGTRRVAVVTQAAIPFGDLLEANGGVGVGVEHRVFTIGDGEPAKSLATIELLCRGFAQWGLTRGDCVVAIGGGVVTDVAGYAASAYHRGIPYVSVPTTLLGMVDAAIGGKTGVNLPEGKNLVGAFWQPRAVLCDTEALDTLPPREYASGLGEIAKYHFLTGDDLGALDLDDRVARCVQIKAEVVAADEREGGRRAILNYGHTLAHAIETAGEYLLRHGEAVAVGLVYAAEVAARLGRIDAARVAAHRAVVAAYGLPSTLPATLEPEELIALFARDKKAVDGVTFVLDGPHGVEPVTGVDPHVLRDAMEAVR